MTVSEAQQAHEALGGPMDPEGHEEFAAECRKYALGYDILKRSGMTPDNILYIINNIISRESADKSQAYNLEMMKLQLELALTKPKRGRRGKKDPIPTMAIPVTHEDDITAWMGP